MKKIILYSLIALGVLGITATSVALADTPRSEMTAGTRQMMGMPQGGGQKEAMLNEQAEMLGLTAEELKQRIEEGKNLWEIAEEQGITKEEMQAKMKEQMQAKMESRIDKLLEEGKITQEEADAMKEKGAQRFGLVHPGFGVGRGPGFEKNAENQEVMLEKKAEMLGLSVEELKQKLDEGKSFWEIAEEQGISPDHRMCCPCDKQNNEQE